LAFLLFSVESVYSIFLAVNPVQAFDGLPVAGWSAIRAPVRIKVRASEIVNLESVKASGHGIPPGSSTSSSGAIGKPVSNEGPPEARRLFQGSKAMAWAVTLVGSKDGNRKEMWHAEVGPRLPGAAAQRV